jgi:ElaB/YqjD/DUF883 family membrane-anchored ribosome-binding protein
MTDTEGGPMKYRWLAVFALATLVGVFAGCSKPETPQQVAAEFWQAMAANDANDVADLSTLANTSEFDTFKRDWLNTLPDFGRVVIDGSKATIVTILPAENATAGERRDVLTYLVQQNDQWLVDYQRTREAVTSRSPLGGLKSDISKLREQFDDAVGRSSEQISEQMDQLVQDFKVYSDEAGKKAEEALETLGESLENFRKQIKESLDEAQKNRKGSGGSAQESLEQIAI